MMKKLHPAINDLKEQYCNGKMSRREFIRYATLLGASIGSASTLLAGCAPEPTAEPTKPAEPAEPTEAPEPSGPRRGGTVRVATFVPGVDHTARISEQQALPALRHVFEYLTFTDWDGITHPFLLENWEASEDLTTWTLNLRQDITFSNGDLFNADDVVFTMKEWLNPEVGSSMRGLMSYLQPEGIEKVDDHTVRLQLDSPQIAIPEHLYHYPAMILNHRTFEGNILDAPIGTGPFTLDEYAVGERVVCKARDDYWQMGEDGDPLPYLDEILLVDLGEDQTAYVSAFKSGQVDTFHMPQPATWEAMKDDPNAIVEPVSTGRTIVLRMRADQEPWNDERVRLALKLCQDRQHILDVVFFGQGVLGADTHVAPAHPEYCPIESPEYDPERAKELLAEAGFPDGLEFDLSVASTGYYVSMAEALKQLAEPAGINVNIVTMSQSQYSQKWTEHTVGITGWGHRPLAVMVLPLAYGCTDGEPASWNESHWCDEEFNELLTKAQGTLDLEERREIMCELERIQQERGTAGISFWQNQWGIIRNNFKNFRAHPTNYLIFREVWQESEA
jgi:peptide/nickel transport system substrate-binding protein